MAKHGFDSGVRQQPNAPKETPNPTQKKCNCSRADRKSAKK